MLLIEYKLNKSAYFILFFYNFIKCYILNTPAKDTKANNFSLFPLLQLRVPPGENHSSKTVIRPSLAN